MRMRKFLAVALSVAMVFSLAACGKTKDNENQQGSENITSTATPEAGNDEAAIVTPDVKDDTAGSILWNSFLETMKANPETSVIDMANTLITNPVIQFMGGANEMEPGYLAGFSEEITDFKSAAMFGPMMGSIAFMGYVFELEDGADVNAFIENLKSKSNPRWNVCVEADYTQVGAYDNTVYFLMYPAVLDEEMGAGNGDAGVVEEATIIAPDVAADTWGATLWDEYVTIMNDNPSSTAVDAAFILSMSETIEFMAGAAEVEPGYLAGFSSDITGFKSAANFGPMMGSIAFVGYVFELEDGADVNAFMDTLKANSDPSWNICVTADQTVVGAYNNMVFFLMCPQSSLSE